MSSHKQPKAAAGSTPGPATASGRSAVLQCEVIQALEDTWSANIFVICLDRPEAEHNVLDWQLVYQLEQAVGIAREKVRAGELDVLVVCSAKDKSFLAGADIQTQLNFVGMKGEAE